MKTEQSEVLDEKQSLRLITEMIQVSKKKIQNDGVLVIAWGFTMFAANLCKYLNNILFLPNRVHHLLQYADPVLPLLVLAYSVYYIIRERKRVTTYVGTSLRQIWIALFVCMVIVNLIINNVLHEVDFSLQHPIFMVLTAFAVFVTGSILRNKLIMVGGAVFGALAFVSSFLVLRDQMLMVSIAWLLAFGIPGLIMFIKREK